jgi:hypothetical protein
MHFTLSQMKTIFITMLVAVQIMQVSVAQSKKSPAAPQAKTVNGTVKE